jgi:hypothetical protein
MKRTWEFSYFCAPNVDFGSLCMIGAQYTPSLLSFDGIGSDELTKSGSTSRSKRTLSRLDIIGIVDQSWQRTTNIFSEFMYLFSCISTHDSHAWRECGVILRQYKPVWANVKRAGSRKLLFRVKSRMVDVFPL